ncbi:hypothetical protein BDC45DRAFT_541750 [Circinella umbellata]|nr:hypothetical protein BDC45DRAFT_541750 [Circinella umbellata]
MTDDTVLQVTQIDGQQNSAKIIRKRFAHYRMSSTSVGMLSIYSSNCSEEQMTRDTTVRFSINYEAFQSYSKEIEGHAGGYIVATGPHINTTYQSCDAYNNMIESIHVVK